MKIALINENSQKKQNKLILKILEKVAIKYGHTVFNYGVSEDKDVEIDYVGAGILTGILLNSQAVDFVVTGCASGEGVMITASAMPNVYCGYVCDDLDMELFLRINAGNAVSIPYGKLQGIGMDIRLESIFEKMFSTTFLGGYPSERKEIQVLQRKTLQEMKLISQINMFEILEEMDKDLLYQLIHNDYFAENFFLHSKVDEISEYLKNIIDAFEPEE